MDFPNAIPAKQIDAKHSDWDCQYAHWERLRKMYEGERTMRLFCSEFLQKRAIEPLDVYNERVQRFSYTNHLKTIIGWYTSALFKQPPDVQVRKIDESTKAVTLLEAGPETEKLSAFQNDADGKGTDFITWWANSIQAKLLLYGSMYVLFDLPVAPAFQSAAQQNEVNALQPHLVAYSPQDVINWQFDEQGQLQWLIIKLRARTQDSPLDPIQLSDRWFWFTTTEIAVYEYIFPASDSDTTVATNKDYPDNAKAVLLQGYPRDHALSDQEKVPVFAERLDEAYHLGTDIVSPLLRLLNIENSHDWALEQSNLATLIIYSDDPPQTIRVSEASFIQLKSKDRAGFLEQSGHAFVASQSRIGEVREEVYRLAHLVQQGRSSSATAAAQSGIAKEADLMPARDVLSALGDQARRSIKRILQFAADRMDLSSRVDVQGLDFPDRSESLELENLERALATVDISASPILERAIAKKVARIMIPDATQELIQSVDKEIDTNPTPSQAEQQRQQLQADARQKQLSQMLNNSSLRDAAEAA